MLTLTNPADNTAETKYDRIHVRKQHTFAEWLGKMIASGSDATVTLVITPENAATMLERNTKNRPFSAFTASAYAEQVKKGEWHYTREPIIFAKSGKLLDGQHRLSAVIEAGASIECDVCFGAPDDAFSYIDIGKKRTAGDIFAINGVKNATVIASAVQWVISYDRGNFTKVTTGKVATRETSAGLYAEYMKRQDLQESAHIGAWFSQNKLASPTLMVALHYICARKCRRDADAFFDAVAHGTGSLGRYDPALALRNKLVSNAIADAKLPARAIGAMTILAWNHHRAGRACRGLRYDADKAFPRAR